ncbi:Microsomal glutathione S-transferase 1 [Phlyctochytrium planicorne]|nr:Microsomal glutathione S-transferase 1 [Phlyctochytrium planicorne]
MSQILSLANPVFKTFATTSTLLLAKTVGLGITVALARVWVNNYGKPEDRFFPFFLNLVTGGRWAPVKTEKDKKVYEGVNIEAETGRTDPTIKRLSGLHSNDIENNAVLILLGFFYVVAANPDPAQASRIFWTLVATRYAHSVAYGLAIQPFRAIFFLTGAFTGLELAFRTLSVLL